MTQKNEISKGTIPTNATSDKTRKWWYVSWPSFAGTSILSIMGVAILTILFLIVLMDDVEACGAPDNSNSIQMELNVRAIIEVDEGWIIFENTPSDQSILTDEWDNALATVRPGRGVASDKQSKPKKASKPKTKTDKRLSDLKNKVGDRLDDLLDATRDYYLNNGVAPEEVTQTYIINALHVAVSKDENQLGKIERIARINDESWMAVKEGRALEVVMKGYDRYAIGNEEIRHALVLAVGAMRNVKIPILLRGESQYGKTYTVESLGKMVPPEYWVDTDSLSGKALYYMCATDRHALKNKILYLDELGDASPDVLAIIKGVAGYGKDRMVHRTVVNKRYRELVIAGLPLPLTCTVELDQNIDLIKQDLNRFLQANVDESEDYQDRVIEYHRDIALFGEPEDRWRDEIDLARRVLEILMSEEMSHVRVVNPFIPFITKNMKNQIITERLLRGLAQASAYINRFFNPRIDEDNILVTLRDMTLACEIFESMEEVTTYHLDAKSIQIFKTLTYGYEAPQKELIEMCQDIPGCAPTTVRRKLEYLENAGLVIHQDGGSSYSQDGHMEKWNYKRWSPLVDPRTFNTKELCHECHGVPRYAKIKMAQNKIDKSFVTTFNNILLKLINNIIKGEVPQNIKEHVQDLSRRILTPSLSYGFWNRGTTPGPLNTLEESGSLCQNAMALDGTQWHTGGTRVPNDTDDEAITRILTTINESDGLLSHDLLKLQSQVPDKDFKRIMKSLKPVA